MLYFSLLDLFNNQFFHTAWQDVRLWSLVYRGSWFVREHVRYRLAINIPRYSYENNVQCCTNQKEPRQTNLPIVILPKFNNTLFQHVEFCGGVRENMYRIQRKAPGAEPRLKVLNMFHLWRKTKEEKWWISLVDGSHICFLVNCPRMSQVSIGWYESCEGGVRRK